MEAGTGSWYVSKEEIELRSPSRRDGVSAAKEAELRGTYCSFLRDVGLRLQLPRITIATAILLCHRFYLRQSHARNEWQTVGTVCIFLASKIEDTPCPLQRVVTVAYETMYRKRPDAARRIYQKELLEKRKALILLGESLLLSTIRFDFNIQHPYEPLKIALKNLGITQQEVQQAAVNLVNDTLPTTLVVQFKPHYIAAGSLFVAAKFHNLRLPSENGKVWWNQFDVAPKQLQDVIQQMTHLFMRRSPCFTSHVIKPTPIPTPQEKQEIISIPYPVLKFTYTRRGRIMSTPTPAPTMVKKQQIICTTEKPVPAPTKMKKQQIVSTSDPVPIATMAKKQQIISTPDPVPAPTVVKKEQMISAPDPVSALTEVKKQQSCTLTPAPTTAKKHHIISTPDPVPAPTVMKKEQMVSAPNPVLAPTEVKKQQSCTPTPDPNPTIAKKHHITSTPDPVPASAMVRKPKKICTPDPIPVPAAMKKHQKICTPDPVPRHTCLSRTSLISNCHEEACRYMPADSFARQNSLNSARAGDHKPVQAHTDQGLNKIAMHGRSEKQSSLVALKGDRCFNSAATNRGRSEKSLGSSLMVDRRLNDTRMDGRRSEKQPSWATLKADTLSSIVIEGRCPERQSFRPAPKGNHGLDSTGVDGRWSEKSPQAALKDHHSLNSTGLDGRWSEMHSSWATVKADQANHRLISTGMDRRWSEKQSSWAALKANHVYDAPSVPKDINATGITNLIGHKRRIQEAGDHVASANKSDRGAWTGRQFRSVIAVETKPPSWKRQKYY